MEEESGEDMITSSQAKERRRPGEVRQEEIDDREGSILISRLAFGKMKHLMVISSRPTSKSLWGFLQN